MILPSEDAWFFVEGIGGSGEGMKPTFRLLTDEQKSAIAAAAFELLERVGVKLLPVWLSIGLPRSLTGCLWLNA